MLAVTGSALAGLAARHGLWLQAFTVVHKRLSAGLGTICSLARVRTVVYTSVWSRLAAGRDRCYQAIILSIDWSDYRVRGCLSVV